MNPVWHFVDGVPQIGPPVVLGPLSVSASAVTSTVPILGPDGSATAPTYSFASATGLGIYNLGAGGQLAFVTSGAYRAEVNALGFGLASDGALVWRSSTGGSGGVDVSLSRVGANDAGINGCWSHTGANGQVFKDVVALTELTTIAATPTTDTTIQMPAGAVVLGVSVRVTTVIPTATTFTVGDSGSATRFSTAAVSVAANSTDPGTKAGAYYNASALSVRITPNGTPANNTGRVRVTIYYFSITPPTS